MELTSPSAQTMQPGSRRSLFLAVNIVVVSAAIVAVGLRVFSRYLKKIRLGWDDFTIFIALVRLDLADLVIVF